MGAGDAPHVDGKDEMEKNMTSNRLTVLLSALLLAFGAWADGPVLQLKEEQVEAWRKAKETCGELDGELCRKRFWEILTPDQRKFYAMDDEYDADGKKKPDPSKSTKEFGLSNKQVGEWDRIAKKCGDPQGEECKRRFKALLTPEQRTFLGIGS